MYNNNINIQYPMDEQLAHINNITYDVSFIQGMQERDTNYIYGAMFEEVPTYTPYFQKMLHKCVKVPWEAQYEEGYYLNRFKESNEPPVKTYRELEFNPIDFANYEKIEGFENIAYNRLIYITICVLFIILIAFIIKK